MKKSAHLNVDVLCRTRTGFSDRKISGRRFLEVDGERVDVPPLVLLVAVVGLEHVVAEQALEDLVLVPATTWKKFCLLVVTFF